MRFSYFFLCASMVVFFIAPSAGRCQNYEGYTYYAPQNGTKAYLIDLSGNVYHSWTFPSNKQTTYSSYLLENGVLLRSVTKQGNYFQGGPIAGEVQKVDWNGNVLWDFVYSTQDYCTHHDICGMPNGNVLLISYERKTAAEATQAGCSQSMEIWPDKIVEIEPSGTTGGNVVWEWHAWDHLVQEFDATKNNYGVVADHPERININYNTSKDWLHVNGIDYNAVLDQITFSSHALSEVFVIDHSTTTAQAASHSGGNSGMGGDILYRWGNPAAYQATGTANFNVVHDAHWVPSWDPRFPNMLAGFNNHGGPGGKTCIDIFDPPVNGYNYNHTPHTAFEPATYAYRHVYSGNYAPNNGNSHQLPNGNMMVTIGTSGLIYEIDSLGNTIWTKSIGGMLAQSFRYPPCYVDDPLVATATAIPSSICAGESCNLTVTVSGGAVYTWEWTSNPSGFSSHQGSTSAIPTETTWYKIKVTNGPCVAVDSVLVSVHPIPEQPSITSAGDSLFSSSSTGNQWYRDNTLIPGATGASIQAIDPGSYQVQVILQGCASAFSDPWIITGTETLEEGLTFFPNPGNGKITLKGTERLGYYSIEVLDTFGRSLFHASCETNIDVSEQPRGIYFLLVRNRNSAIILKKTFIKAE